MAVQRSDVDLVTATLAGDQSAFGELARRYRDAAFGIAFAKLGDFESARDAAQDALVRSYLELKTLRDPSKFGNWLYSITLTTALGFIRRRRDISSLDDPDILEHPGSEPDPQEAALRSERTREVREALMALPEPERLPVILHYVNGYSHAEIGGILGASESSIKNRVYRARHRLRREMLETMEKSLRDERSADVRDICIGLEWYGVPCHNRCKHCSLRSNERLSTVAFERVIRIGEKFLRWKEEQGLKDFGVDIMVGYACDSPEAVEGQLFSRKAGATSWWYYPSNGTRFRAEEELRQHLIERKEQGITTVGVTFYGLREFHDRWAGREGDFDYTMLISKIAAECGLERQETVFFSHEAIDDIPPLIEMLDKLPGVKAGRCVCPWDYRGRGKNLESERVLASDIDSLPESIKQQLSPRYASESEWIKRVEAGDYPKKDRRVYLVSVWEENVEWLEKTGPSEILKHMREDDERLYQAIPTLPTLARLYGQKSGQRVYGLRDLEWKWIDLYLKDHSEIDPAGRFDDLDMAILWH